jgi:hypothetical protein
MTTKQIHLQNETLTLTPLATDGPDALDTHGIPHLTDAKLIGLEIAWQNTAYGLTIKKAPDLFRSGSLTSNSTTAPPHIR